MGRGYGRVLFTKEGGLSFRVRDRRDKLRNEESQISLYHGLSVLDVDGPHKLLNLGVNIDLVWEIGVRLYPDLLSLIG